MKGLIRVFTLSLILVLGSVLHASTPADQPQATTTEFVAAADADDQLLPATGELLAYNQSSTTSVSADDPVPDDDGPGGLMGVWNWLVENWGSILMGLLGLLGVIEVIVKLTPTEKDNAWFKWLKDLFDKLIPNRSKYGGTHP
jgi:hypothetical protein